MAGGSNKAGQGGETRNSSGISIRVIPWSGLLAYLCIRRSTAAVASQVSLEGRSKPAENPWQLTGFGTGFPCTVTDGGIVFQGRERFKPHLTGKGIPISEVLAMDGVNKWPSRQRIPNSALILGEENKYAALLVS